MPRRCPARCVRCVFDDGWMSDPAAAPAPAVGAAVALLIDRQQELLKLEEQRTTSVESQATAILTLIVAIAAFGAASLSGDALSQHQTAIGVVGFLLVVAAGFAVAARAPRSLHVRFWLLSRQYRELEQALAAQDRGLRELGRRSGPDDVGEAVLGSWEARTAVSTYLADRKGLWLTCALISILLAFLAAGIAALAIVR